MPCPRCRYGDYVNGEAGKPLFVSLIVYLDADANGLVQAASISLAWGHSGI